METLIAGSYDRFLFGYECSTSGRDTEQEQQNLQRAFTYPAHKGPVKCVSSCLPYIASGGADDLIHLYDLKTSSDLGFLISPGSGAVSAVAWHTPAQNLAPTHLLSGAADGGISVWQAGGEWTCYKTLYSHKKEVTSVTIHSSGRLCLSTSRQDDLKLWNLVKGKCVHTTRLKSTADQVAFRPSGTEYALLSEQTVAIHAMESDSEPVSRLVHSRKLHCMADLGVDLIATGSEGGAIAVWDQRTPAEAIHNIPRAHQTRIRGIVSLDSNQQIASASSDGIIRVWDVRSLGNSSGAVPMMEANTAARLTCLSSIDLRKDVSRSKSTERPKKKAPQQQLEKSQSQRSLSQDPETRKKFKQKQVQEHHKKVTGVAHDGVVEFPDEDVKNKRTQNVFKLQAAKPQLKRTKRT